MDPKIIENNFKHHPPLNLEIVEMHEATRRNCKRLAHFINSLEMQSCPEITTAIRKVEEAMFWTNAAIARYRSSDFVQNQGASNG